VFDHGTEAQPARKETASPQESDLYSELNVLDLPERVKERLRKLIAAGPPSDADLLAAIRELRRSDEPMRAGLCWFLGRADLTAQQRAGLAPALEACIAAGVEGPSQSAWPLAYWLAYVVWLASKSAEAPFFGWAAASMLLFGFAGLGSRLLQRRRRRLAASRLAVKAEVYALRALLGLRGELPIAPAARLAAAAPPWLRSDAEAELVAISRRLGGAEATLDPVSSGFLLSLTERRDPDVVRASLHILSRVGPGWLASALPFARGRTLAAWDDAPESDGGSLREAFDVAEEHLMARRSRERRLLREEWAAPDARLSDAPSLPLSQQLGAAVQEVRRARRTRRTLIFGGLAMVAVMPATLLATESCRALGLHPPAWARDPVLFGVGTSFLVGCLGVLIGVLAQPAMPTAVTRLAADHGPSIVGLLAEATKALAPGLTAEVKSALLSLLPQVRAVHRSCFTPYQRQCLLDLLAGQWLVSRGPRPGPFRRALQGLACLLGGPARSVAGVLIRSSAESALALQVAILQALMHIGDAGDLAAVRLTERTTKGKARFAVVHAAAVECLAILEERARADDDTDRLVRPADAPDEAMLLRPASGAPTDDDSTLVRPAQEPRDTR